MLFKHGLRLAADKGQHTLLARSLMRSAPALAAYTSPQRGLEKGVGAARGVWTQVATSRGKDAKERAAKAAESAKVDPPEAMQLGWW
jgi:hypothetical protein